MTLLPFCSEEWVDIAVQTLQRRSKRSTISTVEVGVNTTKRSAAPLATGLPTL